ncbi:ferredoxin reductase-like protein [Panus rudis PR-1116 ss-1]|nr:ferredoxin reductase-like protein [Panus rudis PR-1116 ss-1]
MLVEGMVWHRHVVLKIVDKAIGAASAYLFWPDTSRSAPTFEHSTLSPAHFTPVTVVASEPCSEESHRMITLKLPKESIPPLETSALQPIWSIFIKDDDIQVERPYTPLDGFDDNGCMRFWIKKYPRGEVGRWLHSKQPGEKIEIRGPLKTWPWQDGIWDEVVMISGGTGFAPFHQLLHRLLLSSQIPPTKTRFTLLHSSRVPAELPPAELLTPLKSFARSHPEALRLSLFVDTLGDGPAQEHELRVKRIDKHDILAALGRTEHKPWWKSLFSSSSTASPDNTKKVLFLVCGPEPMIAAIAGPFGRNLSQGAVGGYLGEIGMNKDQVWKL